MRVLAIDSSGLTATVAIVEDDTTIAEFTINYKKTHSQTLLPMIDEMVKMVEADLNTIDAIAVAGGPGSFTGLRIGSATAKGLGLALGKPLIHIPTADAMAYSIYGCEDIICPIMDARRNQVYTGIYSFVPKKESEDSEHGQMKYAFQVIRVQMAVSVEDLIRRLNIYGRRVVFLGDGVRALGIRYFKMGRYETAAEHKPDYLRVSQAERERAAKEKNAAPEIRRMVMEDGAAIAELEYSLFRDAWSEKSILETLKQPNAICLIAEKADRTAGYLLAYTAAEEMEIARIGVVKEMRRQGVARELLGALEKIGKQSGIEKILLDVRSGNEAAHKLYTSEGFTEDGIRKHFYSDPDEDAVLMSKTVKLIMPKTDKNGIGFR